MAKKHNNLFVKTTTSLKCYRVEDSADCMSNYGEFY